MTRRKRISEPPAHVRAQLPRLASEANRSNNRIDVLDVQNNWQHHIDTGLLKVR